MEVRPASVRTRMEVRPASVRTRLVAVFAVGSSILLVLTGGLLYIGFDDQLDHAIVQSLRDRAADIAVDLHEGSQQIRPGESFVVLLETSGQVIDATTTAARRTPVLTPRQLVRAREREVVVERIRVTGLGNRGKLLARSGSPWTPCRGPASVSASCWRWRPPYSSGSSPGAGGCWREPPSGRCGR